MTKYLEDLLEAAKKAVLTPEKKERQRRSFAYGNTVIENPSITREDDRSRLRCVGQTATATHGFIVHKWRRRPLRIESRRATVNEVAKVLGVSKRRTAQLVRQVKRIIYRDPKSGKVVIRRRPD
jgi:hypothetical protein